jgi:hypothetical protein
MDLSKSNLDTLYEFVINDDELYEVFYNCAQKHSERMLKEAFEDKGDIESEPKPEPKLVAGKRPPREVTRDLIIKYLSRRNEMTVYEMRRLPGLEMVPSSEMNAILNVMQNKGRVKRTNKKGERLSYYWAWVK